MGNSQTTDGNKKTLSQIVDFVATNYILTQNFQDMKKLSDMKYCNNLVILTSKVLENKLSDIDLEFLAQRMQNGSEVNEMTNDKIKFMNKSELGSLDVKNQTQKRRMCIGIAKHYVKIAHVFAAIVTTIKPNYTYTAQSSSGEKENVGMPVAGPSAVPYAVPSALAALGGGIGPDGLTTSASEPVLGPVPSVLAPALEKQVDLSQKQSIPSTAKVSVKINNLCSQRLNALLNNQDMSGEEIVVKPNFCKMNLDITTNKTKNLEAEPGIPELSKLYYDKYDFDQGGFVGMTESMRALYEKDVSTFYKIFTGKDTVPDNVKTFSDIPLTAYHAQSDCGPAGAFNGAFKGNKTKDRLFKIYAEHIQAMMKTTEANQNKLLDQIDKLFVFNVNPVSKEREVTIRPNLTDDELQKIVEETRNIIVKLYIKCEQDFLEGLEIFEAIVEKQIMDTARTRETELKNMAERKMAMVQGEMSPGEIAAAPYTITAAARDKVTSFAKSATESVENLFASKPAAEYKPSEAEYKPSAVADVENKPAAEYKPSAVAAAECPNPVVEKPVLNTAMSAAAPLRMSPLRMSPLRMRIGPEPTAYAPGPAQEPASLAPTALAPTALAPTSLAPASLAK